MSDVADVNKAIANDFEPLKSLKRELDTIIGSYDLLLSESTKGVLDGLSAEEIIGYFRGFREFLTSRRAKY